MGFTRAQPKLDGGCNKFWNKLKWMTLVLHKPAIDRKGDGREGRRGLGIIPQCSEAQHSEYAHIA